MVIRQQGASDYRIDTEQIPLDTPPMRNVFIAIVLLY